MMDLASLGYYFSSAFAKRILKSDFFHKVSETFLTRLLIIAMGVVTSSIIARVLGPSGRGVLALAYALANFGVQFGHLGLPTSNTYLIAKNRKKLPQLLSNSILSAIGFGFFMTALIAVFLTLFPSIVSLRGSLLWLAFLWIPFGVLYLLLQNLLIGLHEIRFFNLLEIGNRGIILLFVLTYCFSQWAHVPLFFGASLVALIIVTSLALRKMLRMTDYSFQPSGELFQKSFYYSFQNYLIGNFAYFILRSDLFLLDHFLDKSAVGLYSVAQNVGDLVYILPNVISNLLFPKLVQNNEKRLKLTIFFSLMPLFLLSGIYFASFVFLEPLVSLVFGKNFIGAVEPARLIILAMAFYSAGNVLGGYTLAHGQSRPLVGVWIIGAIINVSLNIYLIPVYGIKGPAISTLCVHITMTVLSLLIAIRTKRFQDKMAAAKGKA